jgi:hypothetical protein
MEESFDESLDKFILENNLILEDNVESYSLENFSKWDIVYKSKHDVDLELRLGNDCRTYLIIENQCGCDAFAHWCFESAIYIPIFHKLKKFYPDLKLVLKSIKNFKKLFLEKLGLNEYDICLDSSLNDWNMCFFVVPTSLNEKSCTDYYKKCVDDFCELITKGFPEIHTRDIIMLPRQKLENFKPNDRVYDTEKLEQQLIEKNKFILRTDTITSLDQQINTIRSAKTIILTDGSPFFVNGIFAKNSNIIIIGNITPWQISTFPKLQYIVKKITDLGNTYTYSSENLIIN